MLRSNCVPPDGHDDGFETFLLTARHVGIRFRAIHDELMASGHDAYVAHVRALLATYQAEQADLITDAVVAAGGSDDDAAALVKAFLNALGDGLSGGANAVH